MKKLLLSILIIASFISCKKTDSARNNEIDLKLIKEVKSLSTPNARKIAFSRILNQSEKLTAITDQLTLLTEDPKLNSEQVALVKDLIIHIPSNFYENDGKARDKFMTDYGNAWIKTAANVLGPKFIRDKMTTLNSTNQKANNVVTLNGDNGDSEGDDGGSENGGKKFCKCSQSSDWCNSATEGDCVSANCTTYSSGCGFLLVWDCNGWCSKMLILL
ncbi:hypothetical protein FBD94_20175 [Pedobacter hiemivivus]|uniref:Bacteriocin fulvocin C-related protein n=1 Tax=Pedobacter hiemivivus TaxID=2530454 RepID=A0A4U1G4P9_9SPHI|nr:bacteriocin fulvocin C-related protein [Pedobacter hiemivivus]TKC57600.1 hypothetical protein FBD94_20175 [Pedobacter hiemivivus]